MEIHLLLHFYMATKPVKNGTNEREEKADVETVSGVKPTVGLGSLTKHAMAAAQNTSVDIFTLEGLQCKTNSVWKSTGIF